MPTPNDAPAPPPGEEVQLLPCPFCGAEAGLKFTEAGVQSYGYQRVYCYRNELDCGAKVQRPTTAEVVAAWNRRGLTVARDAPSEVARDLATALAGLMDAVGDMPADPSECWPGEWNAATVALDDYRASRQAEPTP